MIQIVRQGKKYKITEYENSNIYVVENAIEKELCYQMISEIKEANCKRLCFSDINNVECFKVNENEVPQITEYFIKLLLELLDEMSFLKKVPLSGMSNIEIRKVYGETRLHPDGTCTDSVIHPTRNHYIKKVRSLTIVGVLNDDYDGGEYYFPAQNVKLKLKAGSFVIFPPYWTHPHSVSKITTKPNCNEYRYIVSTWGLDNFAIKYKNDENINNIIVL
uniref:Prolyl 4-hydroxylase alpha subunit Fe(2+) 2OG dioxygenase domain-containing protein n=1 Tax=viral metagenome TaxID=1070528 RepID=A0A6C0B803_9ZZZZ